jgi:hypothetical protein
LLARYNHAETLVYGTQPLNFNRGNRALKFVEGRLDRRPQHATPVEVGRILTPEERSNKEALLAALAKRLLQGKLKPKQEQVLREYLDSQGELDDHDILETIRLMMSTPEFQLC